LSAHSALGGPSAHGWRLLLDERPAQLPEIAVVEKLLIMFAAIWPPLFLLNLVSGRKL
jgi:hypothetical protein